MDTDANDEQSQRRIELSSLQDLAYLIANVRRAAAERITEAFPQIEGQTGEDELRDQIEELVNEYIDKTFTLAAPNLSINGLPVAPEQFLKEASSAAATRQSSSTAVDEEVYEPFDTAKRRRLAELVTQEETLLEQVAALKRSVPANVAAEHERTLTEALRRDEELLQATLERAGKRDPASSVKLDIQALERQEGVESGFKKAVDGLARLKREMPSVVARMERARVAGEYVVSDRQ